jgi:hypothetical protein
MSTPRVDIDHLSITAEDLRRWSTDRAAFIEAIEAALSGDLLARRGEARHGKDLEGTGELGASHD